MDRLLFWAIVIGIFLLGAWGADMKKKEREQNPPQHQSTIMRCGSLSSYQEQSDCMKREEIENIVIEDPSADPRRR